MACLVELNPMMLNFNAYSLRILDLTEEEQKCISHNILPFVRNLNKKHYLALLVMLMYFIFS